jgi:predicted ATP-dependent endonuclease of OLD family
VLLVDEAETHLHYDAQANLVDTFFSQDVAAQVIYTTHSPGCLPPDLGTGIRIVTPSKSDLESSEVRNSFWGGPVPGFSPLLLAMGASAAAFSVTRYAVIAEGPSEMILLPSLLRSALGEDHLPYQIAPGLSEAGIELYPELDGEAARTVFVVDGDPGGTTLRKQLETAGISKKKIRTLGATTLEDVLDAESYVQAVNALLHSANRSKRRSIAVEDLPNDLRSRYVEDWCKQGGLKCPSKVAIAVRLVEDGLAKPSDTGLAVLRSLDREIRSALGID